MKICGNRPYKTILAKKKKKNYIYNASEFMFQFRVFYGFPAIKSSGFHDLREISSWEDERFFPSLISFFLYCVLLF